MTKEEEEKKEQEKLAAAALANGMESQVGKQTMSIGAFHHFPVLSDIRRNRVP